MLTNGSKDKIRDNYGFSMECTSEDLRSREQCDGNQSQQLQNWEKYWKRKQLPKPEKLKKLCRKVWSLIRMAHPVQAPMFH